MLTVGVRTGKDAGFLEGERVLQDRHGLSRSASCCTRGHGEPCQRRKAEKRTEQLLIVPCTLNPPRE
jgi:hypothetical protein